MESVKASEYLRLLGDWAKHSTKHLRAPERRRDLLCYGTGDNTWGVQTNQKALAAYAILSAAEDDHGISRDEALDTALKLLRFSLESHVEGSFHCADGVRWGHTWISVLGLERAAHALEALDKHLADADKALLEKVLVSEATWLLESYPVQSGLTVNNKPESNLWNGAFLHRVARLYPAHPQTGEFMEKGDRFLMNSINIPADALSELIVAGRPAKDWQQAANFFDSFALNHHGYLNVGYMVICLSQVALLHFSFKRRGLKAPDSLYWHAADLWKLVKAFTFPDGRLCRVGGDTRVRYCYCQDYCVPTWLFALDHLGDQDCLQFERRWLDIVKTETRANGDGSFLGSRLAELATKSPLYYTRLESDRAATLSMAACWKARFKELEAKSHAPDVEDHAVQWADHHHGAVFVRSPRRIASWVWEASEKPQGLCLPPTRGDLAEWKQNLAGECHGTGQVNFNRTLRHNEAIFPGGFLSRGTFECVNSGEMAEGVPEKTVATVDVAFAALPDDATVLCVQWAKAPASVCLSSVKSLKLNVPNDLFNGKRRRYTTATGQLDVQGVGACAETLALNSSWANIDGVLTVAVLAPGGSLSLSRPGRRNVIIKDKPFGGGNLHADELCAEVRQGPLFFEPGDTIFETAAAVIICGGAPPNASAYSAPTPSCRTAEVQGQDGQRYLLSVNFGELPAALPSPAGAVDLVSGERLSGQEPLTLSGHAARLFRLDAR